MFREASQCRICGNRELTSIVNLGEQSLTGVFPKSTSQPITSGPLELVKCTGGTEACGLVQLRQSYDLDEMYGANYGYRSGLNRSMVEHLHALVGKIRARVELGPGDLVIDIGSNDGTLLRSFKARGFTVLGVDPARDQARRANESGVTTENAFFSEALARDLRAARGPAAIVTANNVFANVDDLQDLAAGIRVLLAPDGVFTFETGYVADLVRHSVIDNIYHEHLSYYGAIPLQKFFARVGLELIDIEHVETKGGSLRGMVQLAGGPRRVNREAIDRLVHAERAEGFDRPDAYRAFADRMDAVRQDLRGRLADAKRAGAALAGYGASVGVTTLLYYYGLDEFLDYLVDDNPARHGLYTPGQHIPVLPSAVLAERRPDQVVLLAWRYAEPITRRHEEYRKAGGRFLIPLPSVHEA